MSNLGYVITNALTMQSAAVATGNGTALDTKGFGLVSLQILGITSATITFEVTIDDTNWVAVQAVNETTGAVATTATANGIYQVPVTGKSQFRARISTYATGTIYVYARAVTTAPGLSLADIDVAASEDVEINRNYTTASLTIAQNAAITGEFDMTGYAGGIVFVPVAWTAANIGFQIATATGGTFTILRDYLGAPVQISGIKTDGVRAYQIPDEVFAAGYVKLWSKSTTAATETDTNQAAARSLTVVLKG